MKTYRVVDFYGRIMVSGIPTKERAEAVKNALDRNSPGHKLEEVEDTFIGRFVRCVID